MAQKRENPIVCSIYIQLKERALPILKFYKEDLTKHDKRELRKNPGVPFLHFTGDTGTHMGFLLPSEKYPEGQVPYLFATADKWHILEQQKVMVKCMRKVNRQSLILYFDGKKLHNITQDKAEAIIADYVRKIRNVWFAQRRSA